MRKEHDLWYLCTKLTEIGDIWSFSSQGCNKPWKGQISSELDLWYLCTQLTEI